MALYIPGKYSITETFYILKHDLTKLPRLTWNLQLAHFSRVHPNPCLLAGITGRLVLFIYIKSMLSEILMLRFFHSSY